MTIGMSTRIFHFDNEYDIHMRKVAMTPMWEWVC